MTDPSVLVMVLNYNSASDTTECIESLRVQNYNNFEIILMDNDSEDFHELIHYENDPLIHLLRFDENIGFAKAHNEGYRHASGKSDYDYIALINNDASAKEDWLSSMVEIASEHSSDMVSCAILQHQDHLKLDNIGHKMINTGEIVPIAFDGLYQDYRRSRPVLAPCGAAMLIKSNCIQELGFFDDYFSTGYEDAEFGLRAYLVGKSIHYNPESIVYHKISQSVSKIDDLDYRIQQQANIFYSYFKLMPAPAIIINLPFIFIKYLLVILVEFITLKWKYIGIHFRSWSKTIRDWPKIKAARKDFYSKGFDVSSFRILFNQQFFLWFDFQRLIKFVFKSNKTVFDKSLENKKENEA